MLENSLKNIRFINYILAVLLLFAILLLTRNIIGTSFSKTEAPHTVSANNSLTNKMKEDIMQYSAILEKNPFGRPMKLHPIAMMQEAEKPYGSLSDLLLVGTVVGPDKLSYAIIQDKSKTVGQEIFAYKQAVYNYGILNKINSSSVEIKQGSITYTLTIPFEKTSAGAEQHQDSQAAASEASFARKVSDKQYILDRRRVQKSLENPEQILTDARLLPNFINGRQEGFKISEVVSDGLYHSLGLVNGDTLLRINGLEISNPEVAIQAMSALRGMNRVNLDIIRDGKNSSMTYEIR